MFEVIVDWTFVGSSGGVSVLYFDEGATINSIRDAVGVWITAYAQQADIVTRGTVRTSGRTVDPDTGTLTGFWNDGRAKTALGINTGGAVANSTMALVQWLTDDVVNGRRVRGRTYMPGISSKALQSGELAASYVAALQTAAQALADAAVGFGVWHRPNGGSSGELYLVTDALVWREFAVLRGRRN